MEIIQNIWLALNIVFGVWSSRNWMVYFYAKLKNKTFNQSSLGQILDLLILTSCLAYILTFCIN